VPDLELVQRALKKGVGALLLKPASGYKKLLPAFERTSAGTVLL